MLNNNNTFFDINQDVQNTYSRVNDALLKDHDEAMNVCETEEIVKKCADLSVAVVSLWSRTKEELFEGKYDDKIDQMETILDKVFGLVREVIEYSITTGTRFKKKGYDVDGLNSLTSAKQNVIDAYSDFQSNWPKVDLDAIAAARKAYHDGHYYILTGNVDKDAEEISRS